MFSSCGGQHNTNLWCDFFRHGADAGQQLYYCAVQAGFGNNTQLHAVGDGATWIAEQIEQQFGAQGNYLIDCYHLCDYLAAAANTRAPRNQKA